MIVLLAAAAFTISLVLARRFSDQSSRFHILDQPNSRSLHTRPTSRSGGLAILAASYVCGIAAVYYLDGSKHSFLNWTAGAVLLVAGVSYLDDRLQLPSGIRLIVHVSAAVLLVLGGGVISRLQLPGLEVEWPHGVAIVVTVLFVVWMLNLYNFMDGMDGLAGGMAVFGFGTFAALGMLAGNTLFFVMNLIIAGAALGFLVPNFPPARIFMGDVGSSTLGLLAAAFSLWGARDGIFTFWIGVLVFSPFVADATVTLLKRMFQQERIWQAHKTHYYQKLVEAGWGHRRTVLLEYLIMLGCGVTGLWAAHAPDTQQQIAIAGWSLFYLAFFFWVAWLARRNDKRGIAC